MKRLGDGAQAFAERRQAQRQDHEFLEINRGIRMRAAVDDVGHRHGQHFGVRPAQIFEQRLVQRSGGGLGVRQGHGENRVGAELGLRFRAVKLEHRAVHRQLVAGIKADQLGSDDGGDVFDGLLHTLAEITFLVAVTEFDGLIFAGAGAAGHRRATERAATQRHVHFHCWITARIENFARLYLMNFAHFSFISYIVCLLKKPDLG